MMSLFALSVLLHPSKIESKDNAESMEVVLTTAKGPSAGQSTMIIMFDRFLGISHFNKQGGEAGPFQDEMCDYMPGQHRQLLQDFCTKLVRNA
jgi:hypothetical protein